MNDMPITNVEAAQLAMPIYKATTNDGRPGFAVDIIYTLADGRKEASAVKRRRRKDVLPALESAKAAVQRGEMKAMLDDTGAMWSTQQTYRIGPTA